MSDNLEVTVDQEALGEIAKGFDQESQQIASLARKLGGLVARLHGGDWIGQAATAFYREQEDLVLPSLLRLGATLDDGAQMTRHIIARMRDADDEMARIFRSNRPGGTPPAAPLAPTGAAIAGGLGVSGKQSGQPSGSGSPGGGMGGGGSNLGSPGGVGAPSTQPSNAGSASGAGAPASPAQAQAATAHRNTGLLARDPNGLFRDDYMRGLIGSTFSGANSPELRDVMSNLAKRPTGSKLRALLSRLAKLRGRPLADIESEYARLLQVDAAARATAASQHRAPPEALSSAHGDFMGNTRQLRFGKVVGDAFGIDPAFGALLSPTGGLVGAGNMSIDVGAMSNALGLGSSPLAYHGVVHDAAGYLYTYHLAGPGYDYLGQEHGDTSSPYTGHEAGIRYWRQAHGNSAPFSAAAESLAKWRRNIGE